jgi:hypothetical protein
MKYVLTTSEFVIIYPVAKANVCVELFAIRGIAWQLMLVMAMMMANEHFVNFLREAHPIGFMSVTKCTRQN